MRYVDEAKFFADYDAAVKERDTMVATKDAAIDAEVKKAEQVVADNGYSETVKNLLVAEVVAEKEKEFDLTVLNAKVETFEAYIITKEDVEIETETETEIESEENVAEEVLPETNVEQPAQYDEYGNQIVY